MIPALAFMIAAIVLIGATASGVSLYTLGYSCRTAVLTGITIVVGTAGLVYLLI